MFKLTKIINGRQNVPEPEYLPTTAGTGVSYKVGDALVITSEKFAKVSGTDKPTHIAMGSAGNDGATIPAARIEKNMVFEAPVTYSETANAIIVGTKLAITVDGVRDITTSGVATVIDTLGAKQIEGDKVLVIFE